VYHLREPYVAIGKKLETRNTGKDKAPAMKREIERAIVANATNATTMAICLSFGKESAPWETTGGI
jgi:hypothetical protein